MGGFEVVQSPIQPKWMPVSYNNATPQTCYVGQLVVAGSTASCSGVKPWTPAGNADTTADQVPFGVVVGTNNRTPVYSSTYSSEYITSVRTQAAQTARDWTGAEGMWTKGDPQAMVQVAILTPETVLKGRLFNATYGVAPTVATATAVAGSGDGTGFTCGATGFDFTAVAYNATYYQRSGRNVGLYRVGYDTNAGTGAKTFYGPNWPYTCAVGDTYVGVNIALGTCKAMTDSTGQFLDVSAGLGTDYIWIDVLEIHLEQAGNEYCLFKLNPLQLLSVRA